MNPRAKKMMLIAPLAIVGMMVFAAIGGALVMQLWNWLLPPLFGWSRVTFWQALGMLVLCRILFGGFGLHGSGRSGRSDGRRRGLGDRIADRVAERVGERWEGMTPEERERIRQRLREGGGAGPSGSEGAAQ